MLVLWLCTDSKDGDTLTRLRDWPNLAMISERGWIKTAISRDGATLQKDCCLSKDLAWLLHGLKDSVLEKQTRSSNETLGQALMAPDLTTVSGLEYRIYATI